jgi:hypothetical protein
MMPGVAETNSRLPDWAAFTMIIVCAGFAEPADTLMNTGPVMDGSAVKTTEARPPTVFAAGAERTPAIGGSDVIVKFTTVPSLTGLFRMFSTFAVMFVVWPLTSVGAKTLSEIDEGSLVIKKLTVCEGRLPDAAVIVTDPEDVLA